MSHGFAIMAAQNKAPFYKLIAQAGDLERVAGPPLVGSSTHDATVGSRRFRRRPGRSRFHSLISITRRIRLRLYPVLKTRLTIAVTRR